MIRPLMIFALSLGVAACSGAAAPPSWQKPGSTREMVEADTAQCQSQAKQHAERLYPFGSGTPSMGGAGMVAAQQHSNMDRTSAEIATFNDCMEGRGYTRPKPAS